MNPKRETYHYCERAEYVRKQRDKQRVQWLASLHKANLRRR